MKRKAYWAASAAVLFTVALGGCDTFDALTDDKPGNAFSQSSEAAAPAQDAAFVEMATKDGAKEVALGELATERATDPAVKDFAQQMVSDHSAANAELVALADSRDFTVPGAMASAESAEPAVDRLSSLSGQAFDEAYIDLMVEEHRKAIALFEKQAAEGQDPAMAAFAEEKLPTLRQHLAHAESLQASL